MLTKTKKLLFKRRQGQTGMGRESLIQKGEFESLIFSTRRNFIDNFNNNEDNTTMKIY